MAIRFYKVNGMPDHIHVFFGMRPTQSVSDLLQQVKKSSSDWINEKGFLKQKFSWQASYGAFSYAKSQVPSVINYIQNQKEHHRKKSFQEEYINFLKEFEVDYDKPYIFKPIEY
jgi:REP element-mobilizing transposase RayT